MTCIAFDGKTLAADRQASYGTLRIATTKIYRLPNGGLCGGSGDGHMVRALAQWFKDGMDPKTYPQEKDAEADMLYICPDGKAYLYGLNHHPLVVEQPFLALGSGRDFAMAAMHLGKTAEEAVRIAAIFDTGCGHDVDTLTL